MKVGNSCAVATRLLSCPISGRLATTSGSSNTQACVGAPPASVRFFTASFDSIHLMKVQASALFGLELGIAQPQPPFSPPFGLAAMSALPTTCEELGSLKPDSMMLKVTKL